MQRQVFEQLESPQLTAEGDISCNPLGKQFYCLHALLEKLPHSKSTTFKERNKKQVQEYLNIATQCLSLLGQKVLSEAELSAECHSTQFLEFSRQLKHAITATSALLTLRSKHFRDVGQPNALQSQIKKLSEFLRCFNDANLQLPYFQLRACWLFIVQENLKMLVLAPDLVRSFAADLVEWAMALNSQLPQLGLGIFSKCLASAYLLARKCLCPQLLRSLDKTIKLRMLQIILQSKQFDNSRYEVIRCFSLPLALLTQVQLPPQQQALEASVLSELSQLYSSTKDSLKHSYLLEAMKALANNHNLSGLCNRKMLLNLSLIKIRIPLIPQRAHLLFQLSVFFLRKLRAHLGLVEDVVPFIIEEALRLLKIVTSPDEKTYYLSLATIFLPLIGESLGLREIERTLIIACQLALTQRKDSVKQCVSQFLDCLLSDLERSSQKHCRVYKTIEERKKMIFELVTSSQQLNNDGR